MTMIAQATQAVRRASERSAEKLQAFLAGYYGQPLDAGMEADPELRVDWEHGKNRAAVEAKHDHH